MSAAGFANDTERHTGNFLLSQFWKGLTKLFRRGDELDKSPKVISTRVPCNWEGAGVHACMFYLTRTSTFKIY